MIKTVKIKNFQSHKETLLKFSKGFNVIVGENDSGKTAIIRALRWVLFNDLKGDYFRSNWGGDTEVTVVFDDGTKLKRVRTDTENYYVLNGQKLKGFGNKLPDEILNVVKMQDLNFQGQFDNVFLFSESNAEVTRMFNDLFDLDLIDKVSSALNVRKRNKLAEIRNLEGQIKEFESRLELLDWTKEAEKKIQEIEQIQSEQGFLQLQIEKAFELFEKYGKIGKIVDYLEPERALKEAEKLETNIKELKGKITDTKAKLVVFRTIKILDVSEIEKVFVKAEKLNTDIQKLRDKKEIVEAKLTDLDHYISEIEMLQEDLQELEKELHGFVGETCPFCGRKIDETVVNE